VLHGGLRYELAALKVDDFRTIESADNQLVRGGSPSFTEPLVNVGATWRVANRVTLFGGFTQGFGMPDVGRVLRAINTPNRAVDDYIDLRGVRAVRVASEAAPLDQFSAMLSPLHPRFYGSPLVKWLYALGGFSPALLALSGMAMWFLRTRRARRAAGRERRGLRAIEFLVGARLRAIVARKRASYAASPTDSAPSTTCASAPVCPTCKAQRIAAFE
jgi:hypothetical protein